ncbi:MAG TPA: T9SS type A sorting domain-containing protein [Firmicutes bacterium]|nr:T9SS type A sorting domain-containing protein [Bacillota bacterium]
MKRPVMLILVLLFLLVPAQFFAQEWHIETVDSVGDVGKDTSIALDSNGYPHISYYDSTNYDLKYAKWTGSGWDIETVDSGGSAGTSIALDSNDYPHISYNGSTILKYARWTGSDWDIEVVDSSSEAGGYSSIALDSNEYPHISYHYYNPYYEYGYLKYAKWTGSSWEIEVVDSSGYNVGEWTSIALDSNDYPHISYYDWAKKDLKYARWTGSDWSIEKVDSEGYVGLYTSIALDSNEYPHISYYDGTNGDLKYARWTGSDWDIETVDSSGRVGWYTSIALDRNGYPHISYDYLTGYDYDLKYAKWTGSDWSIETVDSEGSVGRWTSIALDRNDYPHISYYDYTNGALKYARYGYGIGIELISFTADDREDEIVLRWSVSNTGDEEIAGFNLYRRDMSESEHGTVRENYNSPLQDGGISGWQKVNTTLITGTNPYSYIDTDVEEGKQYEYKLEAVMDDDSSEVLGTTKAETGMPPSFTITIIYPNPAEDAIRISISTPVSTSLTVEVYDITGRLVIAEAIGEVDEGESTVLLDTASLASGVYAIKAKGENGDTSLKRMIILR